MLMMKNKENLKDVKSEINEIPKKIATIPVYTEVEKEANVILIKSLNFTKTNSH